MQRDFAVRTRPKMMARLLKLTLNWLVAVEFPVNDDVGQAILAGNRLGSGRKVDDAKTRMAKGDRSVRRYPVVFSIRAAVMEAVGRAPQSCLDNGATMREKSNYSTHSSVILLDS